MKNIFKLSAMILATAFVAGCSQNDELDVTPVENEGQLTIHATASDFVSSDADTRIINEGADTQFEAGDKIGIFAIRSTDNKLLVQNMPLEYAGADWTGNDNKVYYYKNTSYVAYSPYDENLSIASADNQASLQEQIKEHFTQKLEVAGNDQSIAYPSLDLMLASAEPTDIGNANAKSLSFDFKHQLALMEIEVPVKAYLDTDKNFIYAEPFTKDFTLNSNSLTMYPLSIKTEGVAGEDAKAYSLFRFLVKPEMAYTLGGGLKYGAPIQLEEKTVNLETGKYMKYTINAEGAESSYTERAIAVGDYYYADGSICPGTNDGDNIIKENCIGIIFATDNVSVSNGMDGSKKYTNGKVLALENYHTDEMTSTVGASTSSYYVNWGAHEVEEGNAIDKNSTDYDTFSGKLDGYAKTMDFAFSVEAVQNVLKFGKESNKAYAAPISSTGWYMPSIGELIEVFNAFGKSSDGGTYSLTSSDFKENNVNAGNKSATLLNLRNKLVKVDGELLQEFPDSPTSSTSKNYTDRWWSTTEVGDADFPDKQTWVIELKTNGQVKVLNRDKTGAQQASIRPVLAF
ncbi:fimbrillin family protein [Bacteroides clarus]|uniref:fimbrillin family protein n=1 Tax=Bacteroides clarus TaxID=626929 RepID=UPI0011DDFE97|nr:fimbrillin family protein [Bacteroides clarus]